MTSKRNEVQVTLSLKDQMSRQLEKAGENLKGFEKQVRSHALALGIATGVAVGAVATMKTFTDAAQEQMAAERTLARLIDSTGDSWASQEQRVLRVTSALQRKTNFGDEEQIRALTRMIPLLGSVDNALAALPLVMDAATISGSSLATVSSTLSRVLAGQGDVSESLGLSFAGIEGVSDRIAFGLSRVGGAAEANVDPMTQMGNILGDISEKIGLKLLPTLGPAANGLMAITDSLFSAPSGLRKEIEALTEAQTKFRAADTTFLQAESARAEARARTLADIQAQSQFGGFGIGAEGGLTVFDQATGKTLELKDAIQQGTDGLDRQMDKLNNYEIQYLGTISAITNANTELNDRIAAIIAKEEEQAAALEKVKALRFDAAMDQAAAAVERATAKNRAFIDGLRAHAAETRAIKEGWQEALKEAAFLETAEAKLVGSTANLDRALVLMGEDQDRVNRIFQAARIHNGDLEGSLDALAEAGIDVIKFLQDEKTAADALAKSLERTANAQRDLLSASSRGGSPSPTTTDPAGVRSAFEGLVFNIQGANLPNEAQILSQFTEQFFFDLVDQMARNGSTNALFDAIREAGRLFGLHGDVPGFHRGGIVEGSSGTEQLARLLPGEGVFTQGQMRAMGNIIVNFNGPIYGFDDLEQAVVSIVANTRRRGGFDDF